MVPVHKARLFNAEMIDIPTLLYSSVREFPIPFDIADPWKMYLVRAVPPVYVIIGSAPTPPRAGKHPFATWDVLKR